MSSQNFDYEKKAKFSLNGVKSVKLVSNTFPMMPVIHLTDELAKGFSIEITPTQQDMRIKELEGKGKLFLTVFNEANQEIRHCELDSYKFYIGGADAESVEAGGEVLYELSSL